MHNITTLIFDLDGVLVDTSKYHYLAWKKLANELNIDLDEDFNEKLKGISRIRSLEIILETNNIKLDNASMKNLADRKNSFYLDYISTLNPKNILPGVIGFLETAKANNYKLAIGSSSKNSRLILNKLDLSKYFDAIVDGTMVTNTKPDPEVFVKGASLLDVNANCCVVFEDSQAGINAALTAGMYCIGIGSSNNLENANLIISNLSKMSLNILTELQSS
ncbi:beta-phosphoglucomutase [Clostridiaceae bacterium M8S5]|nr:beta-phosphoglucomutase [Clostridiaceae bacterium M8S5]